MFFVHRLFTSELKSEGQCVTSAPQHPCALCAAEFNAPHAEITTLLATNGVKTPWGVLSPHRTQWRPARLWGCTLACRLIVLNLKPHDPEQKNHPARS